MKRDDVLEDDELRLVDVLLEEHLAPAVARGTAPRSRQWLAAAAAMLFGLAVVGGVWWLRRADAERAMLAQGPALQQVTPRDFDDLRKLFEGLQRIRVSRVSADPHGVKVYDEVDVRDPVRGEQAVLEGAAMEAWLEPIYGAQPIYIITIEPRMGLRLDCELTGGKCVTLFAGQREFVCGGSLYGCGPGASAAYERALLAIAAAEQGQDPVDDAAFVQSLRDPAMRAAAFARVVQLRVRRRPFATRVDYDDVVVSDAARVRRVIDGLAAVLGNGAIVGSDPAAGALQEDRVRCELDDGRRFDLRLQLGDEVLCALPPLVVVQVAGALRDDLRALDDEARSLRTSERGVARTLAELQALPTTLRSLSSCLVDAPRVPTLLGRFPMLQSWQQLELPQPSLSAEALLPRHPDADFVRAIARLPLQHLELDGSALDADDLRVLGGMRTLRSLTLNGPGTRDLTAGLQALTNLETLRVTVRVLSLAEVQAIARLANLREVALAIGGDGEVVGKALAAMPALRWLEVAGYGSAFDGAPLVAALAGSKLERLRLTSMQLSPAALAPLAAVASLRQLDLRGTLLLPGDRVAVLQRLRQLELLDVGSTDCDATAVAALRAALPRCFVRRVDSEAVNVKSPPGALQWRATWWLQDR